MTNTMKNSFSIEKSDTLWIFVLFVSRTRNSFISWLIDRILNTINESLSSTIYIKISLTFFSKIRTRCNVFEYLIDIRYLQEQYLLNDNVYINIIYLIALYKVSHTNNSNIRRFNRRLFRIRINIEHAFESLKNKCRNLTELRLRIKNKKNYTYVIRWIIACVILHNILLKI
jgi:hypothetical protein